MQATATCTFTIFVTATINCLQAILIGVMSFKQFFFYFIVGSIGSYSLSVVISRILRRANRLSYVEMLLIILLVAAIINLPFSLWLKYVKANYDLSVVFGFGTPCWWSDQLYVYIHICHISVILINILIISLINFINLMISLFKGFSFCSTSIKQRLLENSLSYVHKYGWNDKAIHAACATLDLSPASHRLITPYFMISHSMQ